jgi:hypothetical protein
VFSQFRGREESFSYLELLAYFLPEYSDIPDYELNMVTQADLKLGSE